MLLLGYMYVFRCSSTAKGSTIYPNNKNINQNLVKYVGFRLATRLIQLKVVLGLKSLRTTHLHVVRMPVASQILTQGFLMPFQVS